MTPHASFPLLLLIAVAPAFGRNLSVLVFGDSWGALDPSWHALQAMFDRHGVPATVRSSAVGGTTACHWASTPDSLKLEAQKHFGETAVDFVWYTAGGNDLEDKYYRACSANAASFDEAVGCMARATAKITNCTDAMLGPFFEQYPAARVMQCGYDVSCVKGRCAAVSAQRVAFCKENVTCGNMLLQAWQPLLLQPLAQKYPSRYTGLDILGTVQQAGGIPGSSVGSPNVSVGAPCEQEVYCVHPQKRAAEAVMEAFWDLYFRNATAAAITASPTITEGEDRARVGEELVEAAGKAAAGPSPVERAKALVARMNETERMTMLNGVWGLGRGPPEHPYVGNVPAIERVGVPWLSLQDGPQGYRDGRYGPYAGAVGTATQWPSGLTVAATVYPQLLLAD